MYVCMMYVCIAICAHVHEYSHIEMCKYVPMQVCMYIMWCVTWVCECDSNELFHSMQ